MKKRETEEQCAKRHLKEQKELTRLEKEQRKPKGPLYLIYFVIVISVIYIADEVTTQIGTQMQSLIGDAIFIPKYGAENAQGKLGIVSLLGVLVSGIAFLYKPLSDRYGRKLFLFINTLGMGLGLVIVGLTTNIPIYCIGACIIAFFTPHDMQAIYIMESAPAKHRAKLYSVIKCIATLGMVIIPILRRKYVPDVEHLDQWRIVYFLPAVITLGIALVALLCIRESDAFLVSRINYLRMTDEERQAAEDAKASTAEKANLWTGLKLCLSNPQLRWILISNALLMFGMIITVFYETIMSHGYATYWTAQGIDQQSALQLATTDEVTKALLAFPFASAFFQCIPGFIADKWGRRISAMVMAFLSIAAYVPFFIGCYAWWNPYLVGALCGAAIGSYWSSGDMVSLMASESAPTNMRVTVTTIASLLPGILFYLVQAVTTLIINIVGDSRIGIVTVIVACIGTVIGLVVMFWKVRDTNGVDLTTVTAEDFE